MRIEKYVSSSITEYHLVRIFVVFECQATKLRVFKIALVAALVAAKSCKDYPLL